MFLNIIGFLSAKTPEGFLLTVRQKRILNPAGFLSYAHDDVIYAATVQAIESPCCEAAVLLHLDDFAAKRLLALARQDAT